MDLHRLGELRSRAYHAAIAAKLAEDPEVVTRARARVDGWERAGLLHHHLAARWRSILALPVAQLAHRLVDEGEEMTLLRSSSPFAGELSARARWRIWSAVRDEAVTR